MKTAYEPDFGFTEKISFDDEKKMGWDFLLDAIAKFPSHRDLQKYIRINLEEAKKRQQEEEKAKELAKKNLQQKRWLAIEQLE